MADGGRSDPTKRSESGSPPQAEDMRKPPKKEANEINEEKLKTINNELMFLEEIEDFGEFVWDKTLTGNTSQTRRWSSGD